MKRILALCCALVLALGMLGCATAEEAAAPKYVFMFIGDGMGSGAENLPRCLYGGTNMPKKVWPYVFLAPFLIAYLTFNLFPLLYSLYITLSSKSDVLYVSASNLLYDISKRADWMGDDGYRRNFAG